MDQYPPGTAVMTAGDTSGGDQLSDNRGYHAGRSRRQPNIYATWDALLARSPLVDRRIELLSRLHPSIDFLSGSRRVVAGNAVQDIQRAGTRGYGVIADTDRHPVRQPHPDDPDEATYQLCVGKTGEQVLRLSVQVAMRQCNLHFQNY